VSSIGVQGSMGVDADTTWLDAHERPTYHASQLAVASRNLSLPLSSHRGVAAHGAGLVSIGRPVDPKAGYVAARQSEASHARRQSEAAARARRHAPGNVAKFGDADMYMPASTPSISRSGSVLDASPSWT